MKVTMTHISRFTTFLCCSEQKSELSRMNRLLTWGALFGLAVSLGACSSENLSGGVNKLLLTVEPGDRPGTYALSGTTDLPEGTELTVQAVRQLTPTGQAVPEDNPNEHYAILDRDRVEVANGSWSAELQLWQDGNGGNPAESWQLKLPQSDRSFTPSDEVVFTVTMPPTGDEQALEAQWEKSKLTPGDGVVSFTPDGEWFLQAQDSRPIAPPEVSASSQANGFNARQDLAETEAAIPLAEAVEGDAAKVQETTTTPLAPSELMR
jgi:hypothetical protein